ncbi:hypothetical protein F4808DRAFT_399171 [Astrocystis sublimbata]|nr:hypothetical protein F4808DRAFT_399171 [Astrocystis sublimbata]
MESPAIQLTPDQLARSHETKGPSLIAGSSFFIFVCTVSVGLRLAARVSRRMKICLDDWLSVLALLFFILYAITTILAVPYGLGKHIWATDPAVAYKVIEIGFFNAIAYLAVNWLIKLSILAFYRRVFTLNITWFRYSVYACFIYITGWFVGTLFGVIFQCAPVDFFWNQYNFALSPMPTGSCSANSSALVIGSSALNSIGDIVILGLPVIMIGQLQLPQSKKVALALVFATGIFAIAAGITRLAESVSVTKKDADSTWITSDIYLWTVIEAGVGLFCSCLPVIGPFFGLIRDKASSYFSNRSSRKTFQSFTDQSSKPFSPSDTHPSRLTEVVGGSTTKLRQDHTSNYGPVDVRGITRTDEFDLESLQDHHREHTYQ